MKKLRTAAALAPVISMWVILSACGSSPEETPDDVHEYCASLDQEDAICDELDTSAESSAPTPAAEQTGGLTDPDIL